MALLEVITASVGTLPEGTRFELPADVPFQIGRAPENDLAIPTGSVTRLHAQLFFRDGAWWVEDRLSTNGTFLNGRSARAALALADGDFIDVGGVTVLRFAEGTPPARWPRAPELEALVAADPRSDAPWQVWADWLLEHGDPLGAWMVSSERSPEELARKMGPLALRFASRRLGARWNRFGFLHTLRLPFVTTTAGANPLWAVQHLELVPAARFLVGLELEVIPISFDPLRYDRGDAPTLQLLAALERAPLPASLRVLHFDGRVVQSDLTPGMREMMRPPPRQTVDRALERLRGRCPRLETTADGLISWDVLQGD